MTTLLEQFLCEEADQVRQMLLDAIDSLSLEQVRGFSFNRFNVRLDGASGTALIEDDLDTSTSGNESMPLGAFAAALRSGEADGRGAQPGV